MYMRDSKRRSIIKLMRSELKNLYSLYRNYIQVVLKIGREPIQKLSINPNIFHPKIPKQAYYSFDHVFIISEYHSKIIQKILDITMNHTFKCECISQIIL
jgi:hypothetical protein